MTAETAAAPRWQWLAPACALILLMACFAGVVIGREQFAYRDAATFYYPLYLRVQREWDAGRWPLWDPGQNSGVPLLGLPMAAVLYPGKVLFAVLAYPWATRLYTVAHVALAWAGMFVLARGWRLSSTAAGLAALAYAFGAPVLFQYCNIIYLVGAAWIPWGFRALEALLAGRRRWGVLGLAVVLALQILGGDPEAAYLTLAAGGVYALVLAGRDRPDPESARRGGRAGLWLVLAACWIASTLGAAYVVPRLDRPAWLPVRTIVQVLVWGVVGAAILRRGVPIGGGRFAPLVSAVILALALSTAQLLPALEYSRTTARAALDVPGRIFGFCVEPYRLIEAAWPDAFGRFGPENRSWIQALPPVGERMLWTPSLYLGGLTLVFAAGGLALVVKPRAAPAWAVWLALVGAVALGASLGRFGGPLWLARCLPGGAALVGPHDPLHRVDRVDGFLDDGQGSVYGLLALVLPGFSLFRYPAKLLSFAALAAAGLAGLGWDRLAAGQTRAPLRSAVAVVAATLLVLGLVIAGQGPLAAWVGRHIPADVEFGPVDPPRAVAATIRGLMHGGLVAALGLVLARWAPRYPHAAGAGALLVMALDLGLACAPLVWSVPQADFEVMPAALPHIANAERRASGLYRVHRMEMVAPRADPSLGPRDRLRAQFAWQRDTLEPLLGLRWGVEATLLQGALDSADYIAFFSSRAAAPAGAAGSSYVYTVPRRGFSLWNSRYLIMPVSTNGWIRTGRDVGLERLYPEATVVADPAATRRWIARQDWQLLRNTEAFRRAWLVHDVRVRPPTRGPGDPDRFELMMDLVYQADPQWRQPGRPLYDLHSVAFVETDAPQALAGFVARVPPGPTERVAITRYEPQRVDLDVQLERGGLVILADAFDPGWSLTIDDTPAPIYRTNRLMRGAAVAAGRHTLVYTYAPLSFRVGGAVSIGAVVVALALVPWAWQWPWRRGGSRHSPT
jgi:hypothetical protein